MKKILYVFALLISFAASARQLDETSRTGQTGQIDRIGNSDVSFQLPRFIFNYTNTRVVVKFNNPNHAKLRENRNEINFIVNGTDQKVIFDEAGTGNFYYTFKNDNTLQILAEDLNYTVKPAVISIWYIISPLLGLLLFFMYKIIVSVRKNKTPSKLIVKHNIMETTGGDVRTFTSNLKIVSVKEMEEHF
jgi:hypothetical protein